jgi:hypothetical protein
MTSSQSTTAAGIQSAHNGAKFGSDGQRFFFETLQTPATQSAASLGLGVQRFAQLIDQTS